jgi:predicted kinase
MSEGFLVIMCGLPGSGKTTHARAIVDGFPRGTAVAISRDDLRMTYYGKKSGLTSDQEHHITALQHDQINRALLRGLTVVVHDCNLRMQYRKQLASLADNQNAQWMMVDLSGVPLSTCLERNALRADPVPEEVIKGMWTRYIHPTKGGGLVEPTRKVVDLPYDREMYVPDTSKPKAVIVDIDGTVALHEGVRGPYDTSRYHLDRPNLPIIDMIRHEAYDLGNKILFTSGRDVKFFGVTEEWLYEHVKVPVERLIMRDGPGRDDIVKLDLFDKDIRSNYNVLRAYDDRNRVVAAWRSIGLTCLQVADGDF